jgi:hypothetical protein
MSGANFNPYQASAPETTGSVSPESQGPPIYIFPVWGVVAAAFMAMPLGGSIVLAVNLWRAKRSNEAILSVAIGILATLAVAAAAYRLPFDIPGLYLVPQLIGMYAVARMIDRLVTSSLRYRAWTYASGWWGVGIGTLVFVPLVSILFGAAIVEETSWGTEVAVDGDSVYYSGGATADDARFLAEQLQDAGWFAGTGATAIIAHKGSAFAIRLPTETDGWEDPATVDWAQTFADEIASERFGQPLTIELCDVYMIVRKTIEARE